MLGMTQKAFGHAVGGYSAQTVHNWECGHTNPDFETIDRIYEVCDKHGVSEVPSIYRRPTSSG